MNTQCRVVDLRGYCLRGVRAGAIALLISLPLPLALAPAARAQTVYEIQGGGSSLHGSYGALVNFWGNGYDGWLGVGYLDGMRYGALLRTTFRKDTLRLGNDGLRISYPSDVFGGGFNVLVQGLGYARGTDRTYTTIFAGASAAGEGAPFFTANRAERAFGSVRVRHRVSPRLSTSSHAIISRRQSFMQGFTWDATDHFTAIATAGTGSNVPYGAAGFTWRHGGLDVRGVYAQSGMGFRRADVNTPLGTEIDRENLLVTYEIRRGISVSAGRQNFIQDSVGSTVRQRATGNSALFSVEWRGYRFGGGVYDSRALGVRNLSTYTAVGAPLSHWLRTEAFLLQSRPSGAPNTSSVLVNLRERFSPRFSLLQQVSFSPGTNPRVVFGGNLLTPLGEVTVDYQILQLPYQTREPFRTTLSITARMQIGRYSTNLGTIVRPDGSLDYSAAGGTFIYAGDFGNTARPQPVSMRLDRFIVRGRVLDEDGKPVEGAALEVDDEVAFTNSRGEFFIRTSRARRVALKILLDEFLFPGRWELASAPDSVLAQAEDRAEPIEIVLRRVLPPPAVPPPAMPAPAERRSYLSAGAVGATATSATMNQRTTESPERVVISYSTGTVPGSAAVNTSSFATLPLVGDTGVNCAARRVTVAFFPSRTLISPPG